MSQLQYKFFRTCRGELYAGDIRLSLLCPRSSCSAQIPLYAQRSIPPIPAGTQPPLTYITPHADLPLGKPVWLGTGILLPIAAGLLIFGTAWLSGIAPLNANKAVIIISFMFIPSFLYAIAFNCFAAAGEEFGWRGFLVPELARCMGFSELALISGAIWTSWHFPMMFFGTYHGAGSIGYSLTVFIPSVMGAGLILAWLRLAAGSVWVSVLFHGFWNYFIQQFYPALTVTNGAGEMMLGESGWFVAVFYMVLAWSSGTSATGCRSCRQSGCEREYAGG